MEVYQINDYEYAVIDEDGARICGIDEVMLLLSQPQNQEEEK